MKISNFFFLVLAIVFATACNSYKKGFQSYQLGQYQIAIENLNKAIKKGQGNKAKANFFLAESYRLSNRIDEAEPFYAAALQQGLQDEEAQFYYGYALKTNKKYKEAREHFEKYLKTGRNEEYVERANKELSNLDKLEKLLATESYFKIKHLETINTEEAEYAPVAHDGQLYFTSSRGDSKIYKATGKSFTNLFKASVGQSMEIVPGSVQPLGSEFNTDNRAEGTIAISPDGSMMVFARGNAKGKKGGEEVNLYISYNRNGQWSEPQILRISDPRAWDSTPAFSQNGTTLYFASNRRGGQGGIDIYSASIDARGNWGRVKNLGKEINTKGNEMFPYVSRDNRLYFSSDGHPGLGGLDLFVATRRNGEIEVDNLGVPMNSSADDFSLSYSSYDRGYFSSNRESGKGDDDIYAFINESPDLKIVNYYLVGNTYTHDAEDKKIPLGKVEIRLLDSKENQLDLTTTDEQGNFKFKLEEGIVEYILIGEKPNYFTTRKVFPMEGKYLDKSKLVKFETDTTFRTELILDQIVLDKAIVLDNIYYDFDKADIRPDAAKELDKLVSVLKDNPQIIIELSSHTDSRGDLAYNIDLSQRRAESAVRYIISKGVKQSRITARGYGKTRPIIPDAKTEEEHQINRRTEFKVVEITPEADVVTEELPNPVPVEEPKVSKEKEKEKKEEPKKVEKKKRDAIFDELNDGSK